MRQPEYVGVYPNIYAAIDDLGRPCGMVPIDPGYNAGTRSFIGSELVSEGRERRFSVRKPRQPTGETDKDHYVVKYEAGPFRVPLTPYHREMARSDVLIPATKADAVLLGVPFTVPVEKLMGLRDAAAKQWKADHGNDPPFASQRPPVLPAEEAAAEAPAETAKPVEEPPRALEAPKEGSAKPETGSGRRSTRGGVGAAGDAQ